MKKVYKYLQSLQNLGYKLEIERVYNFAKKEGLVPENFKSILIGGTNGKGSVATILSRILIDLGFNVGTFTSPHLVSPRERIKINLKNIPEKDFILYINKLKEIVERELENGFLKNKLSYFETFVIVSLMYFKDKKIDYGVFEVGLGGRLDATNILNADISVITTVSFDHTKILGKTLKKIAHEKAGIIKNHRKIVVGKIKSSPLKVIERVASEKKAELIYTFDKKNRLKVFDDNSALYQTENFTYSIYPKMKGKHQLINSSIAIKTVEALSLANKNNLLKIEKAISRAEINGRLEIKGKFIFDGAHNIEGALSLKSYLQKELKGKKILLIFGTSKGKNTKKISNLLLPLAKKIIITKAEAYRAEMPENIVKHIPEKLKDKVEIRENLRDALNLASKIKDSYDFILITGSLYLVGDAKKLLKI